MKKRYLIGCLVYGYVQFVLVFLSAGFGHGFYQPLGLVAAPLSPILGLAAFLTLIPMWGVIGWLCAKASRPKYRWAVLIILPVQLISGLLTAWLHPEFNDPVAFKMAPEMLWVVRASVGLHIVWVFALLWGMIGMVDAKPESHR